LFSRKDKGAAPASSADEIEIEHGVAFLGSLGVDNDAETDVVGEAAHRAALVHAIQTSDAADLDAARGRVSANFELETDGERVRVTLAVTPVGYLEDSAAREWFPRVQDLETRGAKVIMCSGVILWDPRLGDPRESDDVPVGVRLDLVDQS